MVRNRGRVPSWKAGADFFVILRLMSCQVVFSFGFGLVIPFAVVLVETRLEGLFFARLSGETGYEFMNCHQNPWNQKGVFRRIQKLRIRASTTRMARRP